MLGVQSQKCTGSKDKVVVANGHMKCDGEVQHTCTNHFSVIANAYTTGHVAD